MKGNEKSQNPFNLVNLFKEFLPVFYLKEILFLRKKECPLAFIGCPNLSRHN
jgi:hypothetical protein